MFDWDTQFGDFRSTLQNTTLTKDELSDLIGIMNAARKEDTAKYAQEWSTYLLESPFVQAQIPSLQGLNTLVKQWQSIDINAAREGREKPTFTVKVVGETSKHNLGTQKNLTNRKNVVPKEDRDNIQAFWDQLTPIIIHQIAKYPTDKNKLYFLDEPNQDCGGGTTHYTLALGQIKDNALLSFADDDWFTQTWDQSLTIEELFTSPDMLQMVLQSQDPEREARNALYYPHKYHDRFPDWLGIKGSVESADYVSVGYIWVDADSYGGGDVRFDFRNVVPFAPSYRTSKLSQLRGLIKKQGPFGINTIDLGTTLLKAHIS